MLFAIYIIFIMVIFCAITGKVFPPELGLLPRDGISPCSGICGVFRCLLDLLTAVVVDALLRAFCGFCGMRALRLCALLGLSFDLADGNGFLQILPHFFVLHILPP